MRRDYRISIGPDEAARARSEPPFPPDRTTVRHHWNFGEAEFGRIPALRRWIADEGFRDVEEIGFASEEDQPSPRDALARVATPATARPDVLREELLRDDVCPTCGRPEQRMVDEPWVELAEEPRAGAVLTDVSAVDAFAMPAAAAESLRRSGLGAGLRTAPVRAPGEPHVIVYSDVGVGEPVAPFGTTGEPCPKCGRAYARGADGRAYPALPRYAMYWIFERPGGDGQWIWNAIEGPLRPMVTPEVARWLADQDPQVSFIKHGWSPDELDAAFLPEQYR